MPAGGGLARSRRSCWAGSETPRRFPRRWRRGRRPAPQMRMGALLDHLLADPAPFVRARIANALGQFGDIDVTDRLVHALGDPAWWVRVRSVESLEQIGATAKQPLFAALDSTDREIRSRAAI